MGSLVVISQNVIDFLAPEIQRHEQASAWLSAQGAARCLASRTLGLALHNMPLNPI